MENEEKKEMKEEVSELLTGNLTVKSLGIIGGIILAVLGAIASGFVFIDEHYVDQDVYDARVQEVNTDILQLDAKTARVIQVLEEQTQQEYNRIYKAIKDGTAMPLIVRRDILLARGDGLSSEERAELSILERKLDELNVE